MPEPSGAVNLTNCGALAILALCFTSSALAQPGFGGRGFGGPGGMGEKREILKTYDKDGDGYLNAAERKAARQALSGQMQFGGRGFRGGDREPPKPGPKLTPADVKSYGDAPLYSMTALRTFFLEFEDADWENELDDFYRTDVDVPATLTVDGKTYRDVGVHFRGNTSYMMAGKGRKKSLSLSLDFRHKEQRLLGYRSLNLMNSSQDPTFMRIALYHEIARQYIPANRVNWVRVAIDGESWGVYVNSQQFNSDFTNEWFKSTKGARWKLPANPGNGSGFAYLGDDPARYRSVYEIKSKDDPKAWSDLINLCKVLNATPPDKLEQALEPLLDVEEALKFLALDKALINNDGYWTRASDFVVYEDPAGRFHAIPQDANETLQAPEGGRGGGGGGGGATLDPFAGSQDPNKALLARLLAVPSLRKRYLGYMRDIAEKWLDWNKMGPKVAQYQALIAAGVEADTRKLDTTANFTAAVTEDAAEPAGGPGGFGGFPGGGGRGGGRGGPGGMSQRPSLSLKSFFEQRRAFLLNYPEIKSLARAQ